MITALLIRTDGTSELLELSEVDHELLAELQRRVGGYIEGVSESIEAEWHAYVDEEGKLKGKPINMGATLLANQLGWSTPDVLAGDAVFLSSTPDGREANVAEFVLTEWSRLSSHRGDSSS